MTLPAGITIRDDLWFIEGQSRDAAQSLSGQRQVVGSLAERWRVMLTPHVHEGVRLAWRKWLNQRRGRIVPVAFGPCSDNVSVGATTGLTGITHSGGATFSSGAGYASGGGAAYLAEDAAARDRVITIIAPAASANWDAGFFGINDCLYEIADSTVVNDDKVTVEFVPPLRSALTAGTAFDVTPTVLMRLVDDAQGLAQRNAEHIDRPTFEMVEIGP